MKIVVAVDPVPDLGEELSLAADRRSIVTEGADWDLDEGGLAAIEAALTLREAAGGGEVIVACVSPPEARGGLLTALALGADRAVLIADDAGEPLDELAVGLVLSRIVEREAPDLVLCASGSGGDRSEAAGIALAGLIGLSRVTAVRRIDPGAGAVTVERALPGGRIERLEVPTPAFLSVAPGAFRPRYATLSAIRKAWGKPFETASIAETGTEPDTLAATRGARVRGLARPAAAGGAEMIDGSPAEIAARIADIIKSRVS